MLKAVVDFMAGLNAAVPVPGNQTVLGTVVSISYYGQNKGRRGGGLDQKLADAIASVKWEGMPAGIVTADGQAYQIIGGLAADNNAKIIDFLGKKATITGDVSEQHGMMVISAVRRRNRSRQISAIPTKHSAASACRRGVVVLGAFILNLVCDIPQRISREKQKSMSERIIRRRFGGVTQKAMKSEGEPN